MASQAIPVPPSPRVLWIELTSKCAFRCIFCSRELRRGGGEHMPFALYRRLIRDLDAPRVITLNYSGESTYYPELIPAIETARSAGAYVELVSVLASLPPGGVEPLVRSGLNRLTVSLHTLDEPEFRDIYGFGDLPTFRQRLEQVMRVCEQIRDPPLVDVAFVAIERNLRQLTPVTEYVRSLGVRNVSVSPIMRRDDIPVQFPEIEGIGGRHTKRYRESLQEAIACAASRCPDVRFSMCHPFLADETTPLGEVPVVYPHELPPGARIHTCEQNPWETAHVLANGDVVPCEVLDHQTFGNLHRESIREIWNGAVYASFRENYPAGATEQCRHCPWKQAYVPAPLSPDIIAARGSSAQLLHGWHRADDGSIIWSTRSAAAVVKPRQGSKTLHVSGVLPRGNGAAPNQLTIQCNGATIGRVENPWEETMQFGLDFAAPEADLWNLDFHTDQVYRPSEWGDSPDGRDLGFGVVLISSKRRHLLEREQRQRTELEPLETAIARADRIGQRLRRLLSPRGLKARGYREGVTVVIPERDNLVELTACLQALWRARAAVAEPIQVVVVVNGSKPETYADLRTQFTSFHWIFHPWPLGFAEAVHRGVSIARYDWTYLLNSDVALDEGALETVLRERSADVFAIASHIRLKDATRFREETNFTTWRINDGLVEAHDLIPKSQETCESAYAGGGASLFRTRLLRQYVRACLKAYWPFYWEDVEWGWRARKAGYRVLFCPRSTAFHTQRATIARHYSPEEIELMMERNRLLFQLRNLTGAGTLENVLQAIADLPDETAARFAAAEVIRGVAMSRVWNHLRPVADGAVLG